MISIVDYNMGNPASIRNMLRKIGYESEITADPQRIAGAQKLILPGVGAFDAGMESLQRAGLIEVLNEVVMHKHISTLGICLGMQLMARRSAEGKRPGLGWMNAEAVRFESPDATLKIPHMGWNVVAPARAALLVEGLPADSRFYFVHSYFVRCHHAEDVLLTTSYGGTFHSGFNRDNIWGVQFHPEKSHRFGMHLLRNFAERC